MPAPSLADTYFSIPELMRLARGSYKRAVDIRLAAGGFGHLSMTSGYLLAYLASDVESVSDRIEGLGIKEARVSPSSSTPWCCAGTSRATSIRRLHEESLALTERGRAANEASFEGCSYIDQELERRLSETEMAGLRRGLAVLGEIKQSLPGPVIRRGLPG